MYPNYLHVFVNINHFIRSTIFTKTHVELFFFFLSDKCGAQFYFPYIQGEIGKIKDIYIWDWFNHMWHKIGKHTFTSNVTNLALGLCNPWFPSCSRWLCMYRSKSSRVIVNRIWHTYCTAYIMEEFLFVL